ncbi:hypothetical protein [Terrabacter sp. NPDC080008]|uniref:hypothetical protein n=1 Tax=Terrabacter sp. NPDC080008 TaxID=3155176 RepID=UPI003450EEE7
MSGTGDPRGAGAPGGGRRAVTSADLPHLDFVQELFLPVARARAYVGADTDAWLRLLARELRVEAEQAVRDAAPDLPAPVGQPYAATPAWTGTAPAAPPTSTPPTSLPVTSAAPATPAPPAVATPGTPPLVAAPGTPPVVAARYEEHRAKPPAPSALQLWWDRTREAVGSDLAVHGLAYLGVLLFFVGAFGLVAFAFGDVAPSMRPLAEAVIAAAPFAAGVLLRRRDALVVGRALEVAGGLLLPVMVVTSFVDGVGVPPDLDGAPLVVVLTILVLALAAGYAAWSRRVPDSALRFLVAPLLWLAVGLATMGVGRAVPQGRDVAVPSAWQAAAMSIALAVTVVAARSVPSGSRRAEAVLRPALPGLVLLAVLDGLTWLAGGAPVGSVLAAGVAVLVALEGLAPRLHGSLAFAPPLWWTVVWAVCVTAYPGDLGSTGWVTAVAGLGYVGILEAADAGRRASPARLLPALGLGLALLATWVDPRWSVISFALASLWSAFRRGHPYAAAGAGSALDAAAVLMPLGLAASAALVWDGPSGLLVMGALMLLLAVPAERGWLTRGPHDAYWRGWYLGATTLSSVFVLAWWADLTGSDRTSAWLLVGAAVAVAGAGLVGPFARGVRPAAVLVPAVLAWLTACTALGLSSTVGVVVPALVALLLVVAVHWPSVQLGARMPVATRAGLGLAALVVGSLLCLLALPTRWGLVVGVAASTAGWGLTGWSDAVGRSAVGSALRRTAPLLGWLPLGLLAAGIPAVLLLTADRAGLLALADPWSSALLTAVAVAYAVATRARLPERVSVAAAWSAYGLALVAPVVASTVTPGVAPVVARVGASVLATQNRVPTAVALVGIVLAVAGLSAERRPLVMTWTAWLAPAPAVLLLAQQLSPWFAGQPLGLQGAMVLVAVGSVLLVGAAGADLRGRDWQPRLSPSIRALLAPATVGAAEVAAAVVLAAVERTAVEGALAGWVTVTAAVALLVTAVLARVGALAGVAVVVAWLGAVELATVQLEGRPWIVAAAAAGLLAAAQVLSWRSPAPAGVRWWARWDLAALLAAVPVALTGAVLGATTAGAAGDLTLVAVGAECAVVAARLRRIPLVPQALVTVGAALVLLGADRAGPGWFALALLVLSVALTTMAAAAAPPARQVLRAAAVLGAGWAWLSALGWLDWSAQREVDLTALAAAVLASGAVVLALIRRTDREWILVWGTVAALAEAVTALDVLVLGRPAGAHAGWALAGGLLVVGAASMVTAGVVSATTVGVSRQRAVATAYVVGAVAAALVAADLGPQARVWVLSSIGVLCALVLLARGRARRVEAAETWQASLLVLGWGTTLLALVVAVGYPATPLLAAALAVAGIEAAATGVARRLLWPQLLAPALASAAWVVLALGSLGGDPQWVVAPVGIAVLVAVGLWRRDQRLRGADTASRAIVLLERGGIILLVGPSLAAALTTQTGYAFVALVLGCLVCCSAAVTRVRRRLSAGVVVVGLSLIALVGVPLVDLLPSWSGAMLWALIGGLGLVAVLAAALVERGKVAVRSGVARLERLTAGWE